MTPLIEKVQERFSSVSNLYQFNTALYQLSKEKPLRELSEELKDFIVKTYESVKEREISLNNITEEIPTLENLLILGATLKMKGRFSKNEFYREVVKYVRSKVVDVIKNLDNIFELSKVEVNKVRRMLLESIKYESLLFQLYVAICKSVGENLEKRENWRDLYNFIREGFDYIKNPFENERLYRMVSNPNYLEREIKLYKSRIKSLYGEIGIEDKRKVLILVRIPKRIK